MNLEPGRPRPIRRSIRLPEYDYAGQGGYFVTIVTAGRACVFGQVEEDGVALSALGRMVEEEWRRTAEMRPGVELDAFVVMPNHVHVILIVEDGCAPGPERATSGSPRPEGATQPRGPGSGSLGAIIGGYKAAVTTRANALRGTPGKPVWQRGYYEHVLRGDRDLERFRRYIAENPFRWREDEEYVG